MKGHRRIEDLATRIAENGLTEGGTGIAKRERPFTEPKEHGLDQGKIEEQEIPLVEPLRPQKQGETKEELDAREGEDERTPGRPRSLREMRHG
jgi:hypothetical protein